MPGFDALVGALSAAGGVYGLLGIVVLAIAWTVAGHRVFRNKNLLQKLDKVPAADRERVLRLEMGGPVFLDKGMSAKDYIRHKNYQYLFLAFLASLVTIAALILFAVLRPGTGSAGSGGNNKTGSSLVGQHECKVVLLADMAEYSWRQPWELRAGTKYISKTLDLRLVNRTDNVAVVMRGIKDREMIEVGFEKLTGDNRFEKHRTSFFTITDPQFYLVELSYADGATDARQVVARPVDEAFFTQYAENAQIKFKDRCSDYPSGISFEVGAR